MKTTTTGVSIKLHYNEVGSPYLHKRNKVGITKIGRSQLARAIVYDQHIIDSLYLDKKITEYQHNACDKYLGMIHASGTFISTPPSERIFTSQYSQPLPRSVILIKVQRMLKKKCGMDVEKRFWKIMTSPPKKLKDIDLLVVQSCSEALLNYWCVDLNSPVSLFQQALANPI